MASSYSTDLKLELMVTGENAGTWGDNTNNNLNLIQQAIAGFESVALSDGGTVALAMTDKTISNARNMVLKFTGTLTSASTVTIPDSIEKFYIFDLSAVTGVTNLTIKTVSGTGFTAGEAAIVAAYSDGTNLNEIALNTLGGTIATAQIADNAVTTAKISDNQVTTAKISDNQITTAKVSDLQITTAKIADDAITPDKLSNTAVTPGSYTTADITVDAQGRITAAASGEAGGSNMINTLGKNSPGTYTAAAGANFITAYLCGGAGGGGGGQHNQMRGATGGPGGFGFFAAPISQPFSQPFTIGTGGTGGPQSGMAQPGRPGNAGNATTLGSLFTANGGVGGDGAQYNQPGSPNPAPAGNVSTNSGNVTDLGEISGTINNVTGGAGGTDGQAAQGSGYIQIFENTGG